MAGIRARVRAEVTAEIVRLARAQVAAEGPGALSLRAIARELGMVSSAIYRYFPSRDELLTRLIIESYDRLGEAVEQADAACPRDDHPGRWRAMTRALRAWALANPSEYALLFGTPVPGYRAPQDTVGPATRYTAVLTALLADVEVAGGQFADDAVPQALADDLRVLQERFGVPVGAGAMRVGMEAWAGVMGAVSLELFGHLHNVVDTPGALFDAVVDTVAHQLTAASPAPPRARRRQVPGAAQ